MRTKICVPSFGANNRFSSAENPNDSEIYNLLEDGSGLRFFPSQNIQPIIEYKTRLAAPFIYASNRLKLWYYCMFSYRPTYTG